MRTQELKTIPSSPQTPPFLAPSKEKNEPS